MSGFMETVLENLHPNWAFFFLPESISKVDNVKIKRKVSLFFSLNSFIFLVLVSFPKFFSLLLSLEAAFMSCEIKVKYG